MISYHKYKSYNLLMLPADVHMFGAMKEVEYISKQDANKNRTNIYIFLIPMHQCVLSHFTS